MENSNQYMTLDLVREVVSQYTWPAAWELEDDLPDGVALNFPESTLYFSEGFEGDVEGLFLSENTGADENLKLIHALDILLPLDQRGEGPIVPGIVGDMSPYGSIEKVRNELNDLCKIAVTHLETVLLGDFNWVQAHMAKLENFHKSNYQ